MSSNSEPKWRNGGFFEVKDFDWSEFNGGSGSRKKGSAITEKYIRTVFDDGRLWLSQKDERTS